MSFAKTQVNKISDSREINVYIISMLVFIFTIIGSISLIGNVKYFELVDFTYENPFFTALFAIIVLGVGKIAASTGLEHDDFLFALIGVSLLTGPFILVNAAFFTNLDSSISQIFGGVLIVLGSIINFDVLSKDYLNIKLSRIYHLLLMIGGFVFFILLGPVFMMNVQLLTINTLLFISGFILRILFNITNLYNDVDVYIFNSIFDLYISISGLFTMLVVFYSLY